MGIAVNKESETHLDLWDSISPRDISCEKSDEIILQRPDDRIKVSLHNEPHLYLGVQRFG